MFEHRRAGKNRNSLLTQKEYTMTTDFAQHAIGENTLMQKHFDFLYDLYAECATIPEIVTIVQRPIELEPERRALCELLIAIVADDACHLLDDNLGAIQQIADARSLHFCGTEEGVQWGKLYDAVSGEIYERTEATTCPDCGGDLRSGEHQVQIDVDDFICYPEPMGYADYLHEAHFDK
jgi:hypothetical protein